MKSLHLLPGQRIPNHILEALNNANRKLTDTKDFGEYKNNIKNIFGLSEIYSVGLRQKFFLGGFIEGEGSINVSLKKHSLSPFGILLDPEFSIAQHVNGAKMLYLALNVFQCGRIRYKHGSNATLVLVIDNRTLLKNIIIPFYKKFVNQIGSEAKFIRMLNYAKILNYIEQGSHKNYNILVNDILPLWDTLRMQKGQKNQKNQKNQTSVTVADAIKYVSTNSLTKERE